MSEGSEPYIRVCRELIEPLIRADGGELYLVDVSSDELVIHLAGRCSGCPGFDFTVNTLIEPCVFAINPNARVVVTHGVRIPLNAVRIVPDDRQGPAQSASVPPVKRFDLPNPGDDGYCDEFSMSETVVDEEMEPAEGAVVGNGAHR